MNFLLIVGLILVFGILFYFLIRNKENSDDSRNYGTTIKAYSESEENDASDVPTDEVIDVPPQPEGIGFIKWDLDFDDPKNWEGEHSDYKKKLWSYEFYGGEWKDIDHHAVDDDYVFSSEGYINYFRQEVCKSTDIITDKELIEFHQIYMSEAHPITNEVTRLSEVNEIKRRIKKTYIDSHKKKYDTETKTWEDFDVNGLFLRARAWMMDIRRPYPPYLWNLVSGNPFDRVFRICRDYTKWKGTLRSSKILFENVCKWESGEIFREGEPGKEYETPLWIDWNIVGKVLLSLKTKLKKDSPEGLGWLKDTVGKYIEDRKKFYDQFGEGSNFFIQEEISHKFKSL